MKISPLFAAILGIGCTHLLAGSPNPQPVILGTFAAGNEAVVIPDPGNAPNTQSAVTGLGLDPGPHGVAYFGSDSALISSFNRSEIFVAKISTASQVSTIDTSTAGYNGTGTIAVAPNLSTALAMGNATSLYVVRAPFNASSTIDSVTLPGSIAAYQTQAIVFNNAGRAFVYHTTGITVLDPPYSAIAFTIPVAGNGLSGAIAITPDGNTLLTTILSGNQVQIFQAPFSAASTSTALTVTNASGLDGIAVTPDGTKAIVVSSGSSGTRAAAISAPFTSASTVETLPIPTNAGSAGFEDVGISADSQLVIITGDSSSASDLPVIFHAPFTAAGTQASAVAIQTGNSNTGRGTGAVRFLPPGLAPGLTIAKSAPPFIPSGDDLTYTLTYSNTGSSSATNVIIRDPLPVGTNFVSATNGGTLTNGNIVFNVGTIAAGSGDQTVSFTVNVQAQTRSMIANNGYTIEADGVTPVPGPPVETNVTGAQLLNISTRGMVMDGDKVLIGGFMITGEDSKKVVIRGMGPSIKLGAVPLQGRLNNPRIRLMQGDAELESNDSWRTNEEEVTATGLAPESDDEAVIVRTLDPGMYTVILSGEDDTTGLGLVEVYDAEPANLSRLANISTRGMVLHDDNALIGGFIIGGPAASGARGSVTSGNAGNVNAPAKVIIRAIGPSMTVGDVPMSGRLTDPTLQLVNAHGMTIRINDNWKSDQQEEIEATGLAPLDDHESAIVATLTPGNYTAIVRGAQGGTGIGLVEVFHLPFQAPQPVHRAP